MVKKTKTSRISKLLEKFHLDIVNQKTLEKRRIITSSRLQLILTSAFGFITILSLVFLIIYFTPLKEYFRGYTSTELREASFDNALKLLSSATQRVVTHENVTPCRIQRLILLQSLC